MVGMLRHRWWQTSAAASSLLTSVLASMSNGALWALRHRRAHPVPHRGPQKKGPEKSIDKPGGPDLPATDDKSADPKRPAAEKMKG